MWIGWGKTKVPDVANWVGAIDRDVEVAFRYVFNIALTCVPSRLAQRRSGGDFKAEPWHAKEQPLILQGFGATL